MLSSFVVRGEVALALLIVLFVLRIKRYNAQRFLRAQVKTSEESKKLNEQEAAYQSLIHNNVALERELEDTVALYEITKDICRSLDEEQVFNNFLKHVSPYVRIEDCRIVLDEKAARKEKGFEVIPLKISKDVFRYLVVRQISNDHREKFEILLQHLFLGIKRAILYKGVQELAVIDGLTNVFSRRFLLERLQEELQRSRTFSHTCALCMVDIDHFKEYNDSYGHLVGDSILREICKTMKENIREIDAIGRFGGEEFCLVLAETERQKALFAAERIRQAVAARKILAYDELVQVTVSIGVATFPQDAHTVEQLIEKADAQLYKAKQGGRNKVC
ncbi:MAG: GGDEF domain-containing protein [Candidatus Omnitrophica bacterium]|nr:GGDEF domain-containing protein [Candidatus Omnitrophota bacterium]